jgi:hypothetical protein
LSSGLGAAVVLIEPCLQPQHWLIFGEVILYTCMKNYLGGLILSLDLLATLVKHQFTGRNSLSSLL